MITEQIRKEINTHAHNMGWWDEYDLCKKLLLIVSEACEAMEANRRDKYCKIDEFSLQSWKNLEDDTFVEQYDMFLKHTFQEELADIDIRVNDLAYESGVDMELHILLKHRYNTIKGKDKGKKY